jgi:transcriptional regulator with XRE-family HTH domain
MLKQELDDPEYRYAYAEDFLNTWVATQIVALREQRGLSQEDLGALIGTKQPGISRLENVNHSTWKTETLKRIARALDVRLKISFETFGSLLEEDESFCRESLMRPKFADDSAFKKAAISSQMHGLNLASAGTAWQDEGQKQPLSGLKDVVDKPQRISAVNVASQGVVPIGALLQRGYLGSQSAAWGV